MGKCVICELGTSGSLEFCKNCYHTYRDDIVEKKAWTRTLKNDSQRERRRREKEYANVSLDALLDYEFSDRDRDRRR